MRGVVFQPLAWFVALSTFVADAAAAKTTLRNKNDDDGCVLTAAGVCEDEGETHEDDISRHDTLKSTTTTTNTSTDGLRFTLTEDTSILDVLNPDILHDEGIQNEIRKRLHNHELVVLRDAFVPEFADYVWEELYRDDLEWPAWEEIAKDGFSLSHSNFYWNDVSMMLSKSYWRSVLRCAASLICVVSNGILSLLIFSRFFLFRSIDQL